MRNTISREFQVFVKPAGADCNLRCRYCYYLEKSDLYKSNGLTRMSDAILEKYITSLIEATNEENIFFSWHGGEPTLAGLDFFRRAVTLQKKHKPAGQNIINGIQTNATLLNDDWCKFLSEEGFLVGISIDGPEKLHNKFRVSSDKQGSFRKTMAGYDLLIKYGVHPEFLAVVNSENVKYPQEVYGFLKQQGARYITFLPLVRKDIASVSGADSFSVPAEDFGNFLCAVFDEWIAEDIGRIMIQIIEEAARVAFRQGHTLCIFKEKCGGVPVVEHNGDFYSCDHYVDDKHLIGNINDTSLKVLLDNERQQNFGLVKQTTLPQYCLDCEAIKMCNGECPRNRFIKTPYGEPGLNYLCEGYKRFFTHIKPFVDAISVEWSQPP
jgi:uncharacterized protein